MLRACIRFVLVFGCVYGGAVASVQAQPFCAALAETYYQQVYCQLQARAQTKGLPPFHEFKKNTEPVQFSLLKRPAQRNAIALPAPISRPPAAERFALPDTQSHAATSVPKPPPGTPVANVPAASISVAVAASTQGLNGVCHLVAAHIMCAGQGYALLGNRSNNRLRSGALGVENTMALPPHQGQSMNVYLHDAYGQYLHKMCDIGLCGVTMTHAKFVYLFGDIQSKGLNFVQRFETMFSFLKKDKATMGVSDNLPSLAGLELSHCDSYGEAYIACAIAGRNLVFMRQ